MPKAQALCAVAKLDLGDRGLGEVEKKKFITLPGKGGQSRFMPLKIVYPNLKGFEEEFYSNGSRLCLLIRLGWIQGLYSLIWSQVIFFTNFLFYLWVWPINNVVIISGEKQRNSATHIQVCILPQTPFPSRLPYNIEQISMCYTVSPYRLSILNIAGYTCPSQTS